jgi:glycosyltransferase involved in cell wall biosynthesis
MRILIATQNLVQPNNGQATFVRNLAEGMAAKGNDVLVVTPAGGHEEFPGLRCGARLEIVPSINLRPWYPEVYVTLRPQSACARILASFRPDLVHIQDHYPLGRGMARAARKSGLPMIGTNHFLPDNMISSIPLVSSIDPLHPLIRRILWRQALSVYRGMDAYTAPTRTAAEIFQERCIGREVQAISNGIDLDAFRPNRTVDREGVRQRFGLDPGAPLLLYVGRLDPEKRLDVLLAAFRQIRDGEAQLAVVGRGRLEPELRRRADLLGTGRRVRFLGFVPDQEVHELLASADCFAMPSEAELQSIATLEAMATGLPVLASDAGALPEIVQDGVNGALFHSGDPDHAAERIRWLLEHRAHWPDMGAASLETAHQHALPITIAAFAALYEKVLTRTVREPAGSNNMPDIAPKSASVVRNAVARKHAGRS